MSQYRHAMCMTDTISVLIPAASALAGVLLAQVWNAWREKSGREQEISKLLWDERRKSIFNFLKALNIAKDETRALLFTELSDDSLKKKIGRASATGRRLSNPI